MTLAFQKIFFRDGDQISVDEINDAERSANSCWRRAVDRRYFHSFFRVPFSFNVNTDSADLRTVTVDADLAYKIRAIEFFVSDNGTARTHTLSVSGASFTTQTITLVGRGSVSAVAYSRTNLNVDVIETDTVSFTWSASGGVTIPHAYAVVHIVSDRHVTQGGVDMPLAMATPQNLKSGATMVAANFNDVEDDIQNNGGDEEGRYAPCIAIVQHHRNAIGSFSASPSSYYSILPAAYLVFMQCKAYLCADAARTLTYAIHNQSGTLQDSAAVAGVTVNDEAEGDLNVDGAVLQSTHDPEAAASDWTLRFTAAGSGTIEKSYIVLVLV